MIGSGAGSRAAVDMATISPKTKVNRIVGERRAEMGLTGNTTMWTLLLFVAVFITTSVTGTEAYSVLTHHLVARQGGLPATPEQGSNIPLIVALSLTAVALPLVVCCCGRRLVKGYSRHMAFFDDGSFLSPGSETIWDLRIDPTMPWWFVHTKGRTFEARRLAGWRLNHPTTPSQSPSSPASPTSPTATVAPSPHPAAPPTTTTTVFSPSEEQYNEIRTRGAYAWRFAPDGDSTEEERSRNFINPTDFDFEVMDLDRIRNTWGGVTVHEGFNATFRRRTERSIVSYLPLHLPGPGSTGPALTLSIAHRPRTFLYFEVLIADTNSTARRRLQQEVQQTQSDAARREEEDLREAMQRSLREVGGSGVAEGRSEKYGYPGPSTEVTSPQPAPPSLQGQDEFSANDETGRSNVHPDELSTYDDGRRDSIRPTTNNRAPPQPSTEQTAASSVETPPAAPTLTLGPQDRTPMGNWTGRYAPPISVGLVARPYPPFFLPGRYPTSVSYTVSSNGAFITVARGKGGDRKITLGPKWQAKQGDTIGWGYYPETGALFCTFNGRPIPVPQDTGPFPRIVEVPFFSAKVQPTTRTGTRGNWTRVSTGGPGEYDDDRGKGKEKEEMENKDDVELEMDGYIVASGMKLTWYPTVGSHGSCQLLINCGQQPFIFGEAQFYDQLGMTPGDHHGVEVGDDGATIHEDRDAYEMTEREATSIDLHEELARLPARRTRSDVQISVTDHGPTAGRSSDVSSPPPRIERVDSTSTVALLSSWAVPAENPRIAHPLSASRRASMEIMELEPTHQWPARREQYLGHRATATASLPASPVSPRPAASPSSPRFGPIPASFRSIPTSPSSVPDLSFSMEQATSGLRGRHMSYASMTSVSSTSTYESFGAIGANPDLDNPPPDYEASVTGSRRRSLLSKRRGSNADAMSPQSPRSSERFMSILSGGRRESGLLAAARRGSEVSFAGSQRSAPRAAGETGAALLPVAEQAVSFSQGNRVTDTVEAVERAVPTAAPPEYAQVVNVTNSN
ncbi:hypothetical protein M427DRAFT_66943 [Gonapodya prolifera JEL478]|uniref:SPRY domain-containing protein n=1 Tax=Gonapodya prolifera (strain JEL478) TaxID=1344416 RepID=A0A139ASW8_GONPJ|nr:hypothetical protein M427DRAFT_66943 [Gonapodya prolifera JEL478]|eukprot:KXS19832.1 hypothetical protein M427DRAFT_66943 [Gonapodya prolifera JEL478]